MSRREPNDGSPCRDCGVHTTPCTNRRGCRHAGRWEWYMVTARIWKKAGGGTGFRCIGCVEKAVGRPLTVADFLPAMANEPHPWNTPRLNAALNRPPLPSQGRPTTRGTYAIRRTR